MLLSLFDNLFEEKKPKPEAPKKLENFELEVNGRIVPVRIQEEKRFNNRIMVNANGVLIRIAANQSIEEKKKHIDNFLKWAKTKLDKNPQLLDYLPQRKYTNGEILVIGKHSFRINIFYHDNPKSSAKLFNDQIVINLTRGLNKEAEDSTNSYLVARCLSRFFTPIVSERLHELNRKYFGKTINSVRMKYNTSNWGSCSTQGNINISVRLMFAPDEVIDYVLIHELAHLVHADHSPRFWTLVEKIDPDYYSKEKHLTANNFKYYL
ncbi:MAG: M48 family metallopeptidase [Bacteroidetes bacterium]|nr:M48 family metallopeptidase [Bacteroidota bacterium]